MKLFVVVRRDLTPSQSAVQGGHALAEYMLNSSRWKNSTLVYLGIKNLRSLERLKYRLDQEGTKYYEFREPDIGNQPTAISCDVGSKLFEKLNLL